MQSILSMGRTWAASYREGRMIKTRLHPPKPPQNPGTMAKGIGKIEAMAIETGMADKNRTN